MHEWFTKDPASPQKNKQTVTNSLKQRLIENMKERIKRMFSRKVVKIVIPKKRDERKIIVLSIISLEIGREKLDAHIFN